MIMILIVITTYKHVDVYRGVQIDLYKLF